MKRMLLAELAILVEFQSVRIILLVLIGLIIAVLALSAGQCYCVAHSMHSLLHKNKCRRQNVTNIIYHTCPLVSIMKTILP